MYILCCTTGTSAEQIVDMYFSQGGDLGAGGDAAGGDEDEDLL